MQDIEKASGGLPESIKRMKDRRTRKKGFVLTMAVIPPPFLIARPFASKTPGKMVQARCLARESVPSKKSERTGAKKEKKMAT